MLDMPAWMYLVPILFPMVTGAFLLIRPIEERKQRQRYVAASVIVNAVLAVIVLVAGPQETFTFLRFSEKLSLTLGVDGLGRVFGVMVSLLWPLTTFYSFEYMKHEGGESKFFGWFTVSFGVVLGVSMANNFMTLYFFYELLTLATLPLVMHSMDGKARYAGKKYLIYSLSGAAFAFIAIMMLLAWGESLDFTYGGVLNPYKVADLDKTFLMEVAYVLGFFGFGVKAAIFPFHGWLPDASVAPTPVSALLHAVAVVKAGVFAVMRLTYYGFGAHFLIGSRAQTAVMIFTIVTIVYGSAMALRTPHLKRRLAYSTISNLSYILFSVTLMTPSGLVGGLAHMVFHAAIKITLFFVAGAIIYKTHREYIYELDGFGKAMPKTMFAFTVASLGLMGIPPLAGFVSKWSIGTAAVQEGFLGKAGAAALILSALLTALYLVSVILRAYFPAKDAAIDTEHVEDPNGLMTVPMTVLAVVSVLLGLFAAPLMELFRAIGAGLM